MPKVEDEKGNVVAKMSYNKEGKDAAEKMVSDNPNYEVVDAGSRNESYQLGGLIPGQEGFGQRPMIKPPLPGPTIKPPLPGTASSLGMYDKGGPVDKKAGRKARREARKEFRERKKEIQQDKKLIKREKDRESFEKKRGSYKVFRGEEVKRDYRGKVIQASKPNPEFLKHWTTSGGGSELSYRAEKMDEGYEKERKILQARVKRADYKPSKKQLKELKQAAKKEKKAKIKATRK